jgi:dihydroxyacetone kinase
MKKIINNPENVVDEMCRGIALAHGDIENITKYRVLKRRTINRNKVSLVSGGGSGHEPAHAGFVGVGMLDAAVCGDVFASPSQIQIYHAIKATAGDKGTLLIIKNYSGDVMNFQSAALLAETDGLIVDYIKVADDIAVMDSLYTVGRRGVAGTVFVHKVAGAAAEAGKALPAVKRIAQKAADNVRSIGFAFTSCTVPAKGSPTFELAPDEMESGIGIHGEPGVRREKLVSCDELATRMVESLVKDLGVASGDRIAILINGFGATPLQELYVLNQAVMRELNNLKLGVFRVFVGNYMTSIEMAGASLSIMRMDDELAEYLGAPCSAPAFRVDGSEGPGKYVVPVGRVDSEDSVASIGTLNYGSKMIKDNRLDRANVIFLIDAMAKVILENEVPFCELDSHAGDGDFGMSLAKGFRQVRREWQRLTTENSGIADFLNACSLVIMEHCGGASGPIWGFAFKYAAKSAQGKDSLSVADVADMLQASVDGIQAIGERSFGRGAVVGDKTLIDALVPCADAWKRNAVNGTGILDAMRQGAEAAVDGSRKTENIVARMGRAGTVGERSKGYPDAGAYALGIIFTRLAADIEADIT